MHKVWWRAHSMRVRWQGCEWRGAPSDCSSPHNFNGGLQAIVHRRITLMARAVNGEGLQAIVHSLITLISMPINQIAHFMTLAKADPRGRQRDNSGGSSRPCIWRWKRCSWPLHSWDEITNKDHVQGKAALGLYTVDITKKVGVPAYCRRPFDNNHNSIQTVI